MFDYRYWNSDSLDQGINYWDDLLYYQSSFPSSTLSF